jgi:hypothetical protein
VFAYAALLSWPVIAAWLYRIRPREEATLWTIMGAHLFLPVGASIKIEAIPSIDKISVATLSAFAGCWLVAEGRRHTLRPSLLVTVLLLMFFAGPMATSLLNNDEIHIGGRTLPGVGLYDAVSAIMAQFILFCPFFLGRRFLRTASDVELVLRVVVVAGLIYSLPMLFEVRFSPQLHNWVYGYYPRSFLQQMRDGGFRPVVFIGHGLFVALFSATTVIAAAALWRTRARV